MAVRRPLDADEKLRQAPAADAHLQRADPLHDEVARRHARLAGGGPRGEQLQALARGPLDVGRHGRHQPFGPGEELGLRPDLSLLPQARHEPGLVGPERRIVQPTLVAAQELVGDEVDLIGPAAIARGHANRSDEAHQVDDGRALGGVVEVVQAIRRVGEGVLLDVRVAVQADLDERVAVAAEGVTDAARPWTVDEAEERVRMGLEQLHELGREASGTLRHFQHVGSRLLLPGERHDALEHTERQRDENEAGTEHEVLSGKCKVPSEVRNRKCEV